MLNYSHVSKLFLMLGSLVILGSFTVALFIGDFKIQENKVISNIQFPISNQTVYSPAQTPELASAVQEVISEPQEIVRTSSFGENATNKLASSIAKEIIALNPAGPGPEGMQKLSVVNPELVVDKLTASALKNFDPAEFRPHVSPANFNIVEDSKIAFETYFRGFFASLRENFVGLGIGSGASLSAEEANRMLDAYDKSLASLNALSVPKSLIFIHQQELSLVMGQKKMFQMLADYSRDPLQALLAISEGESLHKDFETVGKEIAEFVKINNLTL
jgi:hypothetical protein